MRVFARDGSYVCMCACMCVRNVRVCLCLMMSYVFTVCVQYVHVYMSAHPLYSHVCIFVDV